MENIIVPSQDDYYQPNSELLAAINAALFLKRPLLLAGEPGTGKTECADFVARSLKRLNDLKFRNEKAIRFDTKSISQSTDLFYSYDAVAHFGDKQGTRDKESFIRFNSLGLAILFSKGKDQNLSKFQNYDNEVTENTPFGSVVLIDEIDKAPRDFPNDLLAELEKPPFKFRIKELGDIEIKQNPDIPVFIIITSNNEKGLPDAFLRRCIFHHIDFPDEKTLLQIVKAKLKSEHPSLPDAIATFLRIRKVNLSKIPATSELIDWIACLEQKGLLNNKIIQSNTADAEYRKAVAATLGAIAKSKNDFDLLKKEFGG